MIIHRTTLVLFFLAFPLIVFGQTRNYVIEVGSLPCGRMTLDAQHLANGYMEYDLREERSVRTLAGREETWLHTVHLLADTALRIVSLDAMEKRGDTEWKVKGSAVGDVLYFSRQFPDGETQRWREDRSAVADILLPELLHRLDAPLPEQMLSTRSFEAAPVVLEIARTPQNEYVITADGQMEMLVESAGLLQQWSRPEYGVVVRRSEVNPVLRPCDLGCGLLWQGERLQLPTRPENIRSMELRVILKAGSNVRLFPEDSRQSLPGVSGSSLDTVQLSIERSYQRFEDEELPYRDAALKQYLKPSHYLALDNENIRKRAAELRNWERNGGIVAEAIMRWCGENFVQDEFMPIVTADKIVQAPRGNAAHAALLFVALARKAGVPARFVLGMHPQDGHWQSTVWVEAWTGDWVCVDPIAGRIIEDAQHVKLVHSATFQELLTLAGQLRNNVQLLVDEVERIDESAAAELPTAIVNNVYSNREYRCEITAPSGWLLEERTVGKEIVLTAVPELGSEVHFELHLFANPFLQPTDALFETRVRALSAVLADAEVEEKGEIRFGDRRAPYVIYSYNDSREDSGADRIRTADCMFSILQRGYLLRFTAPAAQFSRYADQLQNILQSMKLFASP
ncbi:transglutaminase family protein [bacterium]|nr:transglutaminase family protein [bacterium]